MLKGSEHSCRGVRSREADDVRRVGCRAASGGGRWCIPWLESGSEKPGFGEGRERAGGWRCDAVPIAVGSLPVAGWAS